MVAVHAEQLERRGKSFSFDTTHQSSRTVVYPGLPVQRPVVFHMVNRQEHYFCFTATCTPVSVCLVDLGLQLVAVSLLILGISTFRFFVSMPANLRTPDRLLRPCPFDVLVVPELLSAGLATLAFVSP